MPTSSTKPSLSAASFLACSLGGFLSLMGYYSFDYLMFCTALPQASCLQFLHNSDIWWIPLFVGSVGTLAGLFFPLLQATLHSELDRIIGILLLMAFVYLPGMFWISNTILWPAFMERYPAIVYQYVDVAQQRQMYVQLLSTTHVGDSFDSLREQLPQKFPSHFREDRGFLDRQFYAIEVEEGMVTSVHVDPVPEPSPTPTRISYIFPDGFTGWAYVCYATPGAAPLPMEGGHMTIEFPASGLVVTSTLPTSSGGYPAQPFRLGPDGPHKLRWGPKGDEVGLVAHYFGAPSSYDTNRTATLRLIERAFVGTKAQMKGISHLMTNTDLCPPAIIRKFQEMDNFIVRWPHLSRGLGQSTVVTSMV